MEEGFLHFIWKFQYFNKKDLYTTDKKPVNVLHPGFHNLADGPDFSQSRIQIGGITWHGSTEIHIGSSDWIRHQHQKNPAYDKVVLHVVWKHDREIIRTDGSLVPTLELKNRVQPQLILDYQRLVSNSDPIPCSNQLTWVEPITIISTLDRVLIERIQKKTGNIFDLLTQSGNDWEEVAYRCFATNFGFKVNSESFFELSRNISFKVLSRLRSNPIQIEALLFGLAGFLKGENQDHYFRQLQVEYSFLRKKYGFIRPELAVSRWNFLRLRPANFPTIRLAQFASFICGQPNLFSMVKEVASVGEFRKRLDFHQSEYWNHHYHFGKKANKPVPGFGQTSIENLVINTLVPLKFAYGHWLDEPSYVDRSLSLLQEIKPEENKITRMWEKLGLQVKSGFDSQALIELFSSYCSLKRCLSCNIGLSLLKSRDGSLNHIS